MGGSASRPRGVATVRSLEIENGQAMNTEQPETSGRRILVTGGAGFLGLHLCERLLNRGDQVVCLDDFYSGSREGVARLLPDPNFDLIEWDVNEPIDLDVDEIYNLACPASPLHYQQDPVLTTRTSVLGAMNVLDLALRRGIKVLQASTSEVYGDPEVSPQSEDYLGSVNPTGPRACYDEGKRCAETLFFDYRRQHGLGIKVARIFNTYGPGMLPDDGRVVSNFITQALSGREVTIFGDGSQRRSFCYVDDLIDGLILLMESADEVSGPINLGRPVETSMLELARRVIEETGARSKIAYKPLPLDDPRQRCPDISRARALLGWEPKVELADGLRATIRYFERSQAAPAS